MSILATATCKRVTTSLTILYSPSGKHALFDHSSRSSITLPEFVLPVDGELLEGVFGVLKKYSPRGPNILDTCWEIFPCRIHCPVSL